ncbi:MAG: acyl carrier protein [Clostridiales bacterium]|jgi:acyl carrier protein|nr:acyl carrier protein [Clostridiales bacterium]
MAQTLDKVISTLAAHLGKDASSISPEASFEELGLDSLDTTEIIMELEEFFEITINADEGLKNVTDLVKLIDKEKGN